MQTVAAQPRDLWNIEKEAVYRLRELFSRGREASFAAEDEKEQVWLSKWASLALYPEKPVLSFFGRGQARDSETDGAAWEHTEFFRLFHALWGRGQVRKLITCGGVDDGKSTLIGRIFYDTKSKEERERIAVNPTYLRKDKSIDYALLAGVTEEEACQGITVRASYGAFAWEGCSFLMADVPGHEEYTHQMAFAAAGADTAIIMVAANKGIVPQTRRHTRICHFMGIRTMIFAVNKMDMVDFSERVFRQLSQEIEQMMGEYADCECKVIPVAAKSGANITKRSPQMPWYQGDPLLFALRLEEVQKERGNTYFCMPVQRTCKTSQMKGNVIRKRVVQGEILSGSVKAGDEVFVYPTARRAKVSAVHTLQRQGGGDAMPQATYGAEPKACAAAGDPVGIELDRELDVARGYILAEGDVLMSTGCIEADLLWTSDNRLTQGRRYVARVGTAEVTAVVTKICYQKEVHTGEHSYAEYLTKNTLSRCEICFSKPVAVTCEKESRMLGTVLLMERDTRSVAAYGNIIHTITEEAWKEDTREVSASEREAALGQKAGLILFAREEASEAPMNYAERYLLRMGFHTALASPDKVDERELCSIKRCLNAGLIVLVSADPKEKERLICLLDEKKRIFDCMEMNGLEENMEHMRKKIRQWASELI